MLCNLQRLQRFHARLQNGGAEFLDAHFSRVRQVTFDGQFPQNVRGLPNESLVCFMGCNLLLWLFSPTANPKAVMRAVRALKNKWFFFVERSFETNKFTIHTLNDMTARIDTTLCINLAPNDTVAQMIHANVQDGNSFYKPL